MTTANDLLAAVRSHHSGAAIVHEVVISDGLWDERSETSAPTRRIDALMFDGLQRTALELKVTLADWRRDTYAKRAPWQAVVHRFVYVIPRALWDTVAGRLGTANVDVWDCGIWAVDDDGRVEVVKKARIRPHPEPLPQHVVQALAYRAAGSVLV
jgi:hypothetical protein